MPVSIEEYIQWDKQKGPEDVEKFVQVKQPVYIRGNVYYSGVPHFDREKDFLEIRKDSQIMVIDEGDTVYLEMFFDEELLHMKSVYVVSRMLGAIRNMQGHYEIGWIEGSY